MRKGVTRIDAGTALRLSRAWRRDSQTRVADALGISPSTLRQYEAGRRPVPDDVLARAVEHFGLTPWMRECLLAHPLAPVYQRLYQSAA